MDSSGGASADNGAAEVQSVGVRNFVAARVSEISLLTEQIQSSQSGSQGRTKGFFFQHVSKHMRRRAVSHNPKRLPRRLREGHLSQRSKSSQGNLQQPKRPARKYRKRKKGGILEFNRRQLGKPAWLESHIWHAKRFHMKAMWKKNLPVAPTAKCFRSLFHAAQSRVVMQDLSYLACLEVTGPERFVLQVMYPLMPRLFETDNPVPFYNQEYVYHVRSLWRHFQIAPVRYVVFPEGDDNLKLIMWVHPASKSSLLEEIISVFKLEEVVNLPMPEGLPESLSKEEQKHAWKLLMNKSWHNVTTNIQLKDLDGCLNRIRLTGTKSLTLLKEVLKIGRLIGDGDEDRSERIQQKQEATWKSIKRIAGIPNNTVIPLNVVDPRAKLPKEGDSVEVSKGEMDVAEENEENILCTPQPTSLMRSPIWDEEARKRFLHTKLSDAKLAEIRGRSLIPGTEIDPTEAMNVIPIILIFRAGEHNSNENASSTSFVGIDVIVPCGWLMPFWLAFTSRNARVYGLEFCDYLTFEENPHLLDLAVGTLFSPDSIAYKNEWKDREDEIKAKYFALSPAKRHNLIKLGCAFPFSIDWLRFVTYSFNRVEYDEIEKKDELEVHVLKLSNWIADLVYYLENFKSPDVYFRCTELVPIRLTLVSGRAEERSCICLPTKEDLEKFASGRRSEYNGIKQDPFNDHNEDRRIEAGRQHVKKLAQLRKKRKVARRAASTSKDFDLESRLNELDSEEVCARHSEEISSLWINEDVEDVLSKQSREVIGLVTYAHYSFVRGKSGAMGYATFGYLKKLAKLVDECNLPKFDDGKGHRQFYVLVRNWGSSLHYNWAKLSFPPVNPADLS